MKIGKILLLLFLATALVTQAGNDFVRVNGTHFYKGGSKEPYYFVGTNLWYGPILGSAGRGGNRQRLLAELDSLQALGVTNLRILAGADAGSKNVTSVTPCLQEAPGVYNDTLLVGLDYLLSEMGKRDMVAVIYLNNAWDWSGGIGFYLRATGHGDSPDAHGEGYKKYLEYARDFNNDKKAQELYYNHIRHIVSRVNSITGKPYRDDPTIMAWQVCNEPRVFGTHRGNGSGTANGDGFIKWSRTTTALIKSLDPNHLVSTGSEGLIGCDYNEEHYERQHSDPNVDYLTLHIWPVNWGWASPDRLYDALPNVYVKSQECIDKHLHYANKYNMPLVIEEFGYSRDHTFYKPGSATLSRDAFFRFIFYKVRESRESNGPVAGCNFWGWGGCGRPAGKTWKPGDDFLCDPPHEPQGWYSVYDTDASTLKLIREALK